MIREADQDGDGRIDCGCHTSADYEHLLIAWQTTSSCSS
jgi:hypothetical protein